MTEKATQKADAGAYLDYWRLDGRPFENVPDPESFYLSDSHAWALNLLTYAIEERKAAALLTGEYGSGKTTMVRVLLGRLDVDELATVLINYPMLDGETLFRQILEQLGQTLDQTTSKPALYERLGETFLDNAQRDLHNLIILDEAQALPVDELYEELRMLLNYQLNDRNLVTLLFVGQDDLWNRLEEMPQLTDRFSVKCRLQELDLEQTIYYVTHRLERFGGSVEIFSDEALERIHANSNGVPRRINNLCDLALLLGCQRELETIEADIIESIWT